jgi:hypothetical protein
MEEIILYLIIGFWLIMLVLLVLLLFFFIAVAVLNVFYKIFTGKNLEIYDRISSCFDSHDGGGVILFPWFWHW